MAHSSQLARGVAALVVSVVALVACSDDIDVINPPPAVTPLFETYVALGNSITAGFQSAGINDSTQRESYANLVAQQMRTRFALPLLASPGCPPPIANFQTQARVGGATSTGSTCALRSSASIATVLNNVAVPNAYAIDPTSPSTVSSNALTTFILGGKTQVQRAADARPTFFSLWIGNNDVLAAATSGLLNPTPGVSPGLTTVAQFATRVDATIDGLKAIGSVRGGVLIGVVQVGSAPILFPAATLLSAPFRMGFETFAGGPVTVLPNCVGSTSLLSFAIVAQMRAGTHPRVVSCMPGAVPGQPLVGDIFILDAAEQALLAQRVTDFNGILTARATTNNYAYVDPNPTLLQLRTSGQIPAFPNLASATAPYGTFVSLDGVHPRRPAHRLVANLVLTAINTKYGTMLALVP